MSKQTILASAANITTNYLPRYNGTGYVDSVIYDNGTNVGIGNTNTTYKLDVTGSGRFSGANYLFTLNGGGISRIAGTIGNTSGVLDWGLEGIAGGQLFTGAGAYSGNIGTSSATSFNLCSNSTVRATITSSGNVGIGKTAPDYLLDLYGTGANTTRIRVTGTTNFSLLQTQNDSGTLYIGMDSSTGGGFGVGNYSRVIWSTGAYPLIFSVNDAERMRIASNGNVGIGTSSPANLLSVVQSNSAASTTLDITNSSNASTTTKTAQLLFRISDTANDNKPAAAIVAYPDGVNNISSGMYFSTRSGDGGPFERMRITSGGNVNIGGNAGTGRLQIWGENQSSGSWAIYTYNTGGFGLFGVRNDGYVQSPSTYNNTTANAANVSISSSGYFERSTSSIKYKKDVIDYDKGLAEVMAMRPVYYKGKNPNDGDKQFAGLIAEEIDALGLNEFVTYAEDGSPDALAYQNMIALLTKAIQELSQKVTDQQEQINQLINK